MTIDFEKDQTEVLDKTTNISKLADKIKELQAHQQQLEVQEDAIKQKKKDIEHLSGEVIPTMLSEMGLSFLKLQVSALLREGQTKIINPTIIPRLGGLL